MKHYLHGESVLPPLAIALFALLFIFGPLTDARALPHPVMGILLLVVTLGALLALGDMRKLFIPVLTLFGVVFAIEVASLVQPSDLLTSAKDAAGLVLMMLLCGQLLYVVMKPGRVTVNRIAGAIVVYLMAALLFALLYDLIERLDEGAFMLGSQPPPLAEAGSGFFYLSVITITSVGFGDLSPVHPLARSSVMVEAVFGHIYAAVLLARLVSLEVADRINSRTG